MTGITLQEATGNQPIDAILAAVIGIFELAFPDLIRAYYLTGSYQERAAVPSSDLDVLVIVKDSLPDATRQKLQQMDGWCEILSPVPLDIGFFDETTIFRHCPVNLKLNSLLLYGEDIREKLALPEQAAYLRECMHRAFHRLLWIRGHPAHVNDPLTYPDPAGEFYGYETRSTNELGQIGAPTTERLVGNVLWMATAQLAAATATYYSSKREVIAAHHSVFNDEWSSWMETIYQQCRTHWTYHLPEEPTERAELRQLCAQVLDFENHFLRQYHTYLLSELASPDADAGQEAAKRLNRIRVSAPGTENRP